MKRNLFCYLLFNLFIMILGFSNVSAYSIGVTIQDGDLIKATSDNSSRFYINTSMEFGSAKYFQNAIWGGIAGANNKSALVSVKNGTYYVVGLDILDSIYSPYSQVIVSNSCDNDLDKKDKTGTFTIERCYYKTSTSSEVFPDLEQGINVSCASGYKLTDTRVITDTCANLDLKGLSKRYCKRIFQFTCSEDTSTSAPVTPVAPVAATLSALSVDGVSISPAFSSRQKKYSATVESNVSSIKINASAGEGSSLVSGFGSRTVNLNYGSNTVYVKVKNSAGSIVTYSIVVTRKDNRSTVNTLSNLTISAGTLSPAFSSDVTDYTVDVENSIGTVKVDATLTDGKSSFAAGSGPRALALNEGLNQVHIKVVSEKGETRTYTITINRNANVVPDVCRTENLANLALLKSIEVKGDETTQITIEDFDSLKKTYEGIKIPNHIVNLTVLPFVQDEGDTYKVDGNLDLEVNVPREIRIIVTSRSCPAYTSTYTLNVTRQADVPLGKNADLKSLTIKNHNEFKFEQNVIDYKLTLKKGENELDIVYKPEVDTTNCTVNGNSDLKYGSVVTISCISEDETDKVDYTITIDGVEKGTNTFLVVLIIIVIIIILILLIMRMLGYKVYFNLEALSAAFRGIGEKIKNTFDK